MATRILFFAAGSSCPLEAPLVPLVKTRLGLSDSHLGLLLLCPGVGLFAAMPISGALTGRHEPAEWRRYRRRGGRLYLTRTGVPRSHMASWPCPRSVWGGGRNDGRGDERSRHSGRTDDRAGHDVELPRVMERRLRRWGGSRYVNARVWSNAGVGEHRRDRRRPLAAAVSRPLMLPGGGEPGGPALAMPHGVVLLMGVCCAVLFLAEASVQDWSGVLLTTTRGVEEFSRGCRLRRIRLGYDVCRLVGRPDRSGAWAVTRRRAGQPNRRRRI